MSHNDELAKLPEIGAEEPIVVRGPLRYALAMLQTADYILTVTGTAEQ